MIGRTISHYEITEKLGEGGMGVVYKARDTRLGRTVALKVVNAEFTNRFEREARAIAVLNHPHICTLHEVGEHEGSPYLVMEYVDGKPLKGPLAAKEALPFAIQVAQALAAAHKAGIVHRDLKPDNILLTTEGSVKVLDFGLAKLQPSLAVDAFTVTMTEKGVVAGTAPYMSPEQAKGESVDARSDIFSFGAVLYELLSGRRAFRCQTMGATLAAVISSEPEPLKKVPWEVTRIVRKMLVKKSEDRYQSAEQLLADLEAVVTGTSRASRRRWLALAAALLITVAAAAGFDVRGLRTRLIAWMGAVPSVKLAVLPFANAGGNPDAEYLCQGISESLITDLSRLPNLRVLSRDSAFRFAAQARETREIGRELGASVVLRGRVALGRDSVSISAEMIRTRDDTLLWRKEYNRAGVSVLEIEQDIAREVAQQLRLNLGAEKQVRLAAPRTVSPQAYRSYLLGRYLWNTRTEENLRRSAEAFQQAVSQDPNYALGWAGLADSFLMREPGVCSSLRTPTPGRKRRPCELSRLTKRWRSRMPHSGI